MKTLREYMRMPYTMILRQDDEGDVIARIKEFDGCVADGQDVVEAVANLEHVKELWIQTYLNSHKAIPLPDADDDLPSGKWLQRVPRSLHKRLAESAEAEGVSLNQLVTSMLAEALGHRTREDAPLDLSSTSINLSAGAYATGASKTHLAIVRPQHGKTGESQDESISIELAAEKLPSVFKFANRQSERMRDASGY